MASGGRARNAIGYAVIAALVVLLVGVAGYGPLSFLKRDSGSSKTAATEPVSSKSGKSTTSTTVVQVEQRSYKFGDCVTFDQRPANFARASKVVNCDRPHLLEMATSIDLEDRFDHFPTEAEWQFLYAHDCAASIRRLIGGPLDPMGRYYATGLQPTREGWVHGDHVMWCGVSKDPLTRVVDKSKFTLYTGKVEGATQDRINPVGSCLDAAAYLVPCAQTHTFEVTGTTDLAGKTTTPPAAGDDAAWQRLVGGACDLAAFAYLGHGLVGDQHAAWFVIAPASWAAGRRTVQCTVARYRGDEAVPTVGSLRG